MKNLLILFIMYVFLTINAESDSWKFIVLGDTHVPSSDTLIEMIPYIEIENPDLIIVQGDLVDGGLKCTSSELLSQLTIWKSIFEPINKKGIKIYTVRGNHENDAKDNINVWRQSFINEWALPQNGPQGEEGLTYSFIHKNAKFIGLDNYITLHQINQYWLDNELSSAGEPHVFVFAHEAAFKVFHNDCLDDSLIARDKLWESLSNNGVKAFFCGHDHFYNVLRIDDGDNNSENDVFQFLIGSGGGWLMPKHNLNGNNSIYKPVELIHKIEHGFGVVEITGETNNDLNVNISWHGRKYDSINNKITYEKIMDVISYTSKRFSSGVLDEKSKSNFLSPNPASEYIEISGLINPRVNPWVDADGGAVKIYNTFGECVLTVGVQNFEPLHRIDISHLPAGVYYLELGNRVGKFVIIK